MHLELLFVVAIWAGTFVATKIVLTEISPALSALYRYLIASLILLLIDFHNPERVRRQDYPLIIFLSLTGVTLYYLLQHYGIKYTNATEASILISLSPVFIGIISWLLLGEKLGPYTLLGLGISFTGCLLVITQGKSAFTHLDNRFWGNLLILLTAVSWALYSAYGKRMLQLYSPRTIIKYTTVIGTLFICPFAIAELGRGVNWFVSWKIFLNLLYLGGLASVYGYLAWYRGLGRLPAVTVGSYLYFRPLLTGIIAAIILHEKVGWSTIIGCILVIAGTYLTNKSSNSNSTDKLEHPV